MTREEYYDSLRLPEYKVLAAAHNRAKEVGKIQKAKKQADGLADFAANMVAEKALLGLVEDIKISIK